MPRVVGHNSFLSLLLLDGMAVICAVVVGCAQTQTQTAASSPAEQQLSSGAILTAAPVRAEPQLTSRSTRPRAPSAAAFHSVPPAHTDWPPALLPESLESVPQTVAPSHGRSEVDGSAVVLASSNEPLASDEQLPTPEYTEPVTLRSRSGTLTTLHLNDVSVRQALEMLGRTYGLNILVAPGVEGQVTANLEGLDFNEAFNAILKLCDLVADREQGLIYVHAAQDYDVDIRVKLFPLDYVSAEQVLPVVQTLLSPIGQAVPAEADPANNRKTQESVVVTDTGQVLAQVGQYLDQIDVAPRQVMIEAHMLQIVLQDDLLHGINYKQAMNAMGSGTLEFDITGFSDPLASPAVFARLTTAHVDGLLHMLKTTTDAKTLASPRLMVVNGQKARLQVGDQLPYKVLTITETAAVETVKFLDVGVVLEVTPRITSDGNILMHVKPEVSDGKFDPDSGLPGEETREMEADVLLADGQGMVIGGLIQERDTEIQTKLPVLGDLYWVGRLFQKREILKERTEVVITLVPRIVNLDQTQPERELMDAERSQSELFYGPLCRLPRPWEPDFPDAIENPQSLHGPGPCDLCGEDICGCEPESHRGMFKPLRRWLTPGKHRSSAPAGPIAGSAARSESLPTPPPVSIEPSVRN